MLHQPLRSSEPLTLLIEAAHRPDLDFKQAERYNLTSLPSSRDSSATRPR